MDAKEQMIRVEAAVRAELPVLAAELLALSKEGSHDGGRFRELARDLSEWPAETRLDMITGMVKRVALEAAVENGRAATSPAAATKPIAYAAMVGDEVYDLEVSAENALQEARKIGGRFVELVDRSAYREATRPAATGSLTEDDITKLIGEGYIRAGQGEVDRPLYLLDLARRIALHLKREGMAGRCVELAEDVSVRAKAETATNG